MPRSWFRSRSASPAGPRTLVGLMLQAAMTGDGTRARHLARRLSDGQDGRSDDESAVVEAASELALHQYFGADYDVRSVTALVTEFRATKTSVQMPGHLVLEAVIRSDLGDQDVDLSGIAPVDRFGIRGAVAGLISMKAGWTEPEVLDLVLNAERIAAERGWNPPLADEAPPT